MQYAVRRVLSHPTKLTEVKLDSKIDVLDVDILITHLDVQHAEQQIQELAKTVAAEIVHYRRPSYQLPLNGNITEQGHRFWAWGGVTGESELSIKADYYRRCFVNEYFRDWNEHGRMPPVRDALPFAIFAALRRDLQ